MACERFLDAVADAAAGGLPDSDLVAHLQECRGCQATLQASRGALARAETELRNLFAVHPSPALERRIRDSVSADGAPGASTLRRWVGPALAAAAVLLLVLGLLTERDGDSRPPTAGQTTASRSLDLPKPPTALPSGAAEEPSRPSAVAEPVSPPTSAQVVPSARRTWGIPRATSVRASDPTLEVQVLPAQAEALVDFAGELDGRLVQAHSLLVAEATMPLVAPRPLDVVEFDVVTLDTSYVFSP